MRRVTLLVLFLALVPSFYAKPKKKPKTCGATSIAVGDCPKEGCGGDAELAVGDRNLDLKGIL